MFGFLKEWYYSGEEKWYSFMDKLNAHVPVYGVIDAIDNVVPSFLLFLILVLFILFSGAYILFMQSDQTYSAEFTFVASDGKTKVVDSIVTLSVSGAGVRGVDTNYRTDSDGIVLLKDLKYGQEIKVDVNLSKGTFSDSFVVNTAEMKELITLKQKIDFSSVKKRIITKDSLGMNVKDSVSMSFYCKNKTVVPEPLEGTTVNSMIEVTEPYNCIELHAKVTSSSYEQRDYAINSTSYEMILTPFEPPATELKVKVRMDGYPVSDASFNITASGTSTYTAKTLSSSEATIALIPGTYTVTATDPTGVYATKTMNGVVVDGKRDIILETTKAIRSRIKVVVQDLSNDAYIYGASVSLKNANGVPLAEQTTDNTGTTMFAITDVGSFQVSAKKAGDTNGGYFVKTATLTDVTGDVNLNLKLEKITVKNAGKTKVKVTDQDGEAVSNAKVMLKFVSTDSIVELNQINNWAMTDINGYATLLAGSVEGAVYAYAMKYPITGQSNPKTIYVDRENTFEISMDLGESVIKINLKEENGDLVDGTARIISMTTTGEDVSGLISIENGTAQRTIKAGQQVFVTIEAEDYVNYISEPIMLFPSKNYTLNIKMKKEITAPKITLENIYNETGSVARTFKAGGKYYARMVLEADDKYDDVVMHFRAGKETLMENDYIEIDKVEGAGIKREERGTSYNPEEGYDYDGDNTTDGYAKWINAEWEDFESGIRVVTVWFRIKKTTPPDRELQFFYRANFDGTKDPSTTNTGNDLYDDTKVSNIYYVGEEASCEEDFCVINESLYWKKEDLYVNAPFSLTQAEKYIYKYQLYNNSDTDYGTSIKKMYMNLAVLSDVTAIKVLSYKIKDADNEYSGNEFTKLSNLEIKSFNKNTVVDVIFEIEANTEGASVITNDLKSDGVVLYNREASFDVPPQKEMSVSITPIFVPALVNTPLMIEVYDDKGEPINEATIKTYAKEPGFDEAIVDESKTSRVGKAVVDSGAQFPNTKVIIEVTKEGFARKRFATTVSEEVVAFNPEELSVRLNTISQREETKVVNIGNQTINDLKIVGINYSPEFEGIINEGSLAAHFDSLIGTIIPAGEIEELEIAKVRLVNSITQDNFMEPISLEGSIIITFEIEETQTVYTKVLPMKVEVSSEADLESSCLVLTNSKQTKTTELGQVRFDFELLNACTSEGTDVSIDSIYATFNEELFGMAELSLTSPTSGNAGRAGLDGAKRKVYDKVKPGEKLLGAVIYTPSKEAVGKTITLPITLEGRFQGMKIKTSPSQLNFTVNVLNLKECMSISSDSAPVGFDEKATVTIDSSACLGQTIEVALCRNDPGCSGGAEGKVSIPKYTLSLKGNSETVDVYSPSLPGTYGISVHARVKGKSSFSYIGEVPVSFREPEEKYFKLSKYDLMLVGNGSVDSILLQNSMLTQSVNVKANDCVWGKKDAEFGATGWLMVLSTAMLGASLGNMIGSGFERNTDKSTDKEKNKKAYNEMTPDERAETDKTTETVNDKLKNISSKTGWELQESGTNSAEVTVDRYSTTYTDGQNQQHTLTVDTYTGVDGVTHSYVSDVGPHGYTQVYDISGAANQVAFDIAVTNTEHQQGWLWAATDETIQTTGAWATSKYTYQANATSVNSIPRSYQTTTSQQRTNAIHNTPQQAPTQNIQTPTQNKVFTEVIAATPAPKDLDLLYNSGKLSSAIAIRSAGLLLPSWMSGVYDSAVIFNDSAERAFEAEIAKKEKSASFAAAAQPTTSTYGGWGSAIGAVVGAVLGYMMAEESLYKCSENYSTVPYKDFTCLLQGTTVNVTSPDGTSTEEKTIPSDAGALTFTLDGVSPEWDFTNADYSTTENVGIKFTNNGLNDTKARYGTLTINATTHSHGKMIGDTSSSSASNDDYDVQCTQSTFGEYWIGSNADDGACSGVSEGSYSQKYHIRVISGMPQDEEAYLKKANSCYNGVLTGSTGEEALPRVKLDWDWDDIQADTCAYLNEDYSYCDSTQTAISMIKYMAELEDFLRLNKVQTCPPDEIYQQTLEVENEMNSYTETVAQGYIGVEDIIITVQDDKMTAKVKIANNTGGSLETNYTYAVKGQGEAVTPEGALLNTFASGSSERIIEADVPKFDGVYFFTFVFNGPGGNRRAVTRAFENRAPQEGGVCWAEKTTRPVGGVPSIMYFFDNDEQIQWTNEIQDASDFYEHINFGTYLQRDSFSEDFMKDFRDYYIKNFAEKMTDTERRILDYMGSGAFKFSKRYSGDYDFEAGLYDVWFYIDFGDNFSILDSNANVEVSLLSIRLPVESFPFYYIPFDGMVGEKTGRQGYGAVYKNLTEGKSNELLINSANNLNPTTTFENVAGNGVVSVNTQKGAKFVLVNSTPGTRGQLASVSFNGTSADLRFTPNYATPVIAKHSLEGTSGKMSFTVTDDYQPVNTGSNVTYWTGAAKSRDFYGSAAVEMYNESPDFKQESGDEYGFSWTDASYNGNLYLKTVFFTPTDSSFMLEAKSNGTLFWTPNTAFQPTVQLDGISGMTNNSQVSNSSFETLQDLFNMVEAGDVCISNDGTSMTFWWNPRVLEITPGSVNSLANEELALVGQ